MDRLRDLWEEVASYPVCRTEVAMHAFLTRLCELLGAHSASWLALKKNDTVPRNIAAENHEVVNDGLGGWAAVAAVYTLNNKNFKAISERWMMLARNEGVDVMTKALRAASGKTRVHLRRDLLTDEEWSKDWLSQKFLTHYGVGDRIIAVFSLNEECESCIILDRPLGEEGFGETEKNLVYMATAGTPELHKRMFMEHGALWSSAPLSKRERETYRYLLTGMSEGQIAEQMNLSVHTVHDYARGLYRKFDVKGRVGLMALVLGP